MDGKNDNFENKNLGYFVQKDRATQMQEALYYLQTEIDSVKESAAKSVDIVEELRLLQGEVNNLTDICRADLYALNDKIESSIREQSRNSINLSEEFKKLSKEEKEEIADLCKDLKEKTDANLSEIALSISKLAEKKENNEKQDDGKLMSLISETAEKIDFLFDAIASTPEKEEKNCLDDEKFDLLLNKLNSIEDKLNDNIMSSDNDGLEKRIESIEHEMARRAEENALILQKLDELINMRKDEPLTVIENDDIKTVLPNNSDISEIKAMTEALYEKHCLTESDEKKPIDVACIEEKLDHFEKEIEGRLDGMIEALERSGIKSSEEDALADNDDVMRMLEKLNNQVSNLLSDNQDKISEIKDELDRFKDNFTTVTGGGIENNDDDLKKSFESLSSELDTLSRLINVEKSEETFVPDAILSASDALSKAIDDMTDKDEKTQDEIDVESEMAENNVDDDEVAVDTDNI